MGLERSTFRTEMFIEGNTKMEDLMGLALTNGNLKRLSTREILRMGYVMARVNGSEAKQNTMEDTPKVLKKAMAKFTTQAATSIKAISSTTRKKDMERCSGLTAVSTKANGKVVPKMAKGRST